MGCILGRNPGLSLDLWISKLLCRLRPLFHVTRLTRQTQVAYSVAAPSRARHKVLHLQRNTRYPAIAALTLPLAQQVFTDQVARKLSLLVHHSGYFWLLDFLSIKTGDLDIDLLDRQQAGYQAHRLDGRLRFRAQGSREPPVFAPTIRPSHLAIARLTTPTASAILPALSQFGMNIVAQRH